MKVKAIRQGYYGILRRKVGDVFEISGEKAFSEKWMEKVSAKEPVSVDPEKDPDVSGKKRVFGKKQSESTGDQDVL